MLAQAFRIVAHALAVDVLSEPCLERGEMARSQLVGQIAELLLGRFKKLSRVKIAECIRGKITHCALGPVNVLKTTIPVV